ncbi:MBL fold metallo-hydrolase [Aquibacillus kalidii]|uniref:MBL fold metallo-hydrolase n=1 Tax=Aquibacillus kalidii TaxID=2762597 RepID=UPI001F3A9232|nr:MBL fold metallo-hydrolase [Aquibacillus kalidii]
MLDFIELNTTCFYFKGAVNIGYIHHERQGMLIDAGIDKSTMKKVIKRLKQQALPITHLFITHAHSDHFGGAHYLQEQYDIHTIAPELEEAIMRYPQLEPLYLFGGNVPLPSLHNKFLEGNPIKIDQVISEGVYEIGSFGMETYYLPGHSYHQLAIKVDGILYAADVYFGLEQLAKHKIPFLTDAQLTLESLESIKLIKCDGAVPGHGEFEENFWKTVDGNIAYHHQLLTWVKKYMDSHHGGVTHEMIVADMCSAYEVNTSKLSQWLLFRTTVTGYLLALVKQNVLDHAILENKWTFFSKRRRSLE